MDLFMVNLANLQILLFTSYIPVLYIVSVTV